MKWRAIFACAALAVIGSCQPACACSQVAASAVVAGTVFDAEGSPVPNAEVAARFLEGSCDRDAWTPSGVVADASGMYELDLYASLAPPTVLCFDLYATLASEPQDTAWVRGQRLEAEFTPTRTLVDLRF